jgi:hypothetical protein
VFSPVATKVDATMSGRGRQSSVVDSGADRIERALTNPIQ